MLNFCDENIAVHERRFTMFLFYLILYYTNNAFLLLQLKTVGI